MTHAGGASAILTFQFQQSSNVRVLLINDEPWFCLSDVCGVLDVDRTSDLIRGLDTKGVVKNPTLTPGGKQLLSYLNEPNLYRVIFRSNKPEARKFQDWVFNDVLPSLRKTGRYDAGTSKTANDAFESALDETFVPSRRGFAALPFVDLRSRYPYWAIEPNEGYFSGYETGSTMARQYMAFLRNNNEITPDGSYINLIVESMIKRYSDLGAPLYHGEIYERVPRDVATARGHLCGFLGTLNHWAWVAARGLRPNEVSRLVA